MIEKTICAVVSGGDGTWLLNDLSGRTQACLPSGIAGNACAAEPLPMLFADHYNRGFGQAIDALHKSLCQEETLRWDGHITQTSA